MADVPGDWRAVLTAMATAFADGESSQGEELLTTALDLGAPWDVVTSAAAQAITLRYRPDEAAPSPAAG